MKIKLPVLVLLFVSFIIQSCGEDEMMSSATFEGNWKATSCIGDINITYMLNGNTTISTTLLEALNLDYTLETTDANFVTSGSYNINFTTTVQGSTVTNMDTYSNIINSGTFSNSGNDLVVDGQFFELELNGLPVLLDEGTQTTIYSIANNVMTVTETAQVDKVETSGLESSMEISIISIWEKD